MRGTHRQRPILKRDRNSWHHKSHRIRSKLTGTPSANAHSVQPPSLIKHVHLGDREPGALELPNRSRRKPINIVHARELTVGLVLAFVVATGRADARQLSGVIGVMPPGSDQQSCSGYAPERPVGREQGSVGVMYNLAEHPTSIRAVAKKLLGTAIDASTQARELNCPAPCSSDSSPSVIFRVAPIVLLPKQEQEPLCLRLASETSHRPLKYALREFPNVEKFDAWIMQFTQGMGPDGKLLYQQCGGNCDPAYTFIVDHDKSGLKVDTEVYCGFARDRKSEMFNMSTALRPQCDQMMR